MLINFGKMSKKYVKDKNKQLFYENQSRSPFNSVQDALSIKLWGPVFDDFVDMSIFMILGSWGGGSRKRIHRGLQQQQ